MSQVDKQALREAALNAKIAGEAPVMHFDQRIDALNSFTKLLTPATVIALLDENEALVCANSAQGDHINQLQDRIDTLEKCNAELGKYAGGLETMADNAREALDAVLSSGEVQRECVIDMLRRGLNNQPQYDVESQEGKA
ncbi:ead/Ea22-like family protein [Edwardsiella piscicida]|uniref:ead/Ea22-like family protein n=1 Tax=Edwardsiella piscicida TaxID=1263550 RepID=UPI0018C8C312|nr:ead/Ea22-like family protein [Edwardsiella piscicida]WLJ48333.1 hypothetical protein Q8A59_03890 [Edwardsiella piscicida]